MSLRVHAAGLLTTVQDRGRVGWAHLGVPRAGSLDEPAAALARRLVGGDPDDAVLEVTLGGLEVEAAPSLAGAGPGGHWVAVTGAPAPVRVDGRAVAHGAPVWLPVGARLSLGPPPAGVRSCVAVAGGLAVAPVLGSRSTDTLAGVGPPRVAAGQVLGVGAPRRPPSPVDAPRPPRPGPLRVHPGPRADWGRDGLAGLCGPAYTVLPDSDRIGLRLDGPSLPRAPRLAGRELPSEGVVLGAVQVPPDGRPVVFLADHPPTGGYPVVAVVDPADLWRCAQVRPGERVRFTPA